MWYRTGGRAAAAAPALGAHDEPRSESKDEDWRSRVGSVRLIVGDQGMGGVQMTEIRKFSGVEMELEVWGCGGGPLKFRPL